LPLLLAAPGGSSLGMWHERPHRPAWETPKAPARRFPSDEHERRADQKLIVPDGSFLSFQAYPGCRRRSAGSNALLQRSRGSLHERRGRERRIGRRVVAKRGPIAGRYGGNEPPSHARYDASSVGGQEVPRRRSPAFFILPVETNRSISN